MQSAVYNVIARPSCPSVCQQENHAIAKMTARCAQYVSALKIVGLCKGKISQRFRKNLHIIQSYHYSVGR